MARRTLTYLKNSNKDFENVLDSFLPYKKETIFRWNYTDCGQPIVAHAQDSDTAATTEYSTAMAWPDQYGHLQYTSLMIVGATTAAVELPTIETYAATDAADTAAGLNMQRDQDTAADLGWELNFGSPMGGPAHAFTAGKDSGWVDMTFFAADYTSYDAVSVGFRIAEAYNDGHAPIVAAGTGDPVYTDFFTFGLQESDMFQFASDLNNGGSGTYTDTTDTPTDSQNVRIRVTLNSDGTAAGTMVQNQIANAGTLAAPSAVPGTTYTFDDGDVLIPYIFVHGKDHADTALLIKHIECFRAG